MTAPATVTVFIHLCPLRQLGIRALQAVHRLTTVSHLSHSIPTSMSSLDGPVPLSFPSILRNPKLADRYAYLRKSDGDVSPAKAARRKTKSDNEGRRWVRRKENGLSPASNVR